MSVTRPHNIDWTGDISEPQAINEKLREICAKIEENFQELSSKAVALSNASVDEDGILILDGFSPTVRTTDPLPNLSNEFLDGTGSWSTVDGEELTLSDSVTNNVSSTKHGFAPKSPADATKFLNGAATPAYAAVKDSDLSTSDITTNDVTTSKHGFVPKAPNDTGKFLRGDATWAVPTASGSLIGLQIITTTGSGTYTPTTGTNSIIFELLGAGGGGGGVAQAAAGQVNLATGGGSGAFIRKRLTANFSGASYNVGAKGTGGAAGNNNGTDGGDTTFTETGGGTVYTAGGGKKGQFRGSFAPPIAAIGGVDGGLGGTATNGGHNTNGQNAGNAFATSTVIGWSSSGANSVYGAGANSVTNGSGAGTAGVAATGKGAGGSGAYSSNNAGGNKAGGDGTDGIILIWEYS